MSNLFKANRSYRIPNENPPDFVPNKNQGEVLQEPGPVMTNAGYDENNPPGGPGPVIQSYGGFPNQPIIIGGPGPVINPGQWGPGGGPGNPRPRPPHLKLRPCQGRFTYLWLNNGAEFWFYVQAVTPRYLFGWRIRRGRWEQGRIALNRIETFYCNRRD